MQSTFKIDKEKKSIRCWLIFFMIMLAISGITASPAEWELSIIPLIICYGKVKKLENFFNSNPGYEN